jgi:AAA+ superfamily predicted ATPase
MEKATRFNVAYLLLAMVGVLVAQDLWVRWSSVAQIPYSEFQQLLEEGKIEEVTIGADRIRGTLKEGEEGKPRFVTNRVEPELVAKLDEHGVRYSGERANTFLPMLLSWVIPVFLFVMIWMFLIRRMMGRGGPGGGLMAIGKSQAKVFVETDTRVSFTDVAGVEEAKQELQEIVAFLKDPQAYGRLGARMPRGVLLVGPPGTGKTLLARAVAGEAGVPFFSISGSEFVEMFVGVGAARVRDLFEQARAQAPCIIFIDELDALGRARGAQPGLGGHDEKEQTLNQLLVELDGFDPSVGIVLLGATNRPEILDPALLRAGRFDRHVLLDRPDRPSRVAILGVHLRRVQLAEDVDAEKIAGLTPGFTGADLANLVNEAALVATRRDASAVAMDDFTRAIERIVAGARARDRRAPRDGSCHRGGGAAWHRRRPQGVDHPARHRCAGVHPAAAHRGPLSDDPQGAREQARGAPGRTRCRRSGLRRALHRGGGRSRPGDGHRPQHGDHLRHGSEARPRDIREGAHRLPGQCHPRPGVPQLQRGDGSRDRLRHPGDRERILRAGPWRSGTQRAAAPGERRAAPGRRDPGRERPSAPLREFRALIVGAPPMLRRAFRAPAGRAEP